MITVTSRNPVRISGAYSYLNKGSTLYSAQTSAVGSGDTSTADAATLTPTSDVWVISAGQSYLNETPIVQPASIGASGTKIGLYGVAPVARAAAMTQTYSTAARTVPAATASAPPAGGTGATAGAYDTAGHRDSMIASITATQADVLAITQVVNAIIDDLQALGVEQ